MSFKIAIYGVRDNVKDYYEKLNKYKYEITLFAENLTKDTIETAKGFDGVLVRANSVLDKQNLDTLLEYGIKYAFTSTVGYSHIDLKAAKANGQFVAYVPTYTPFAVAELAFTLAMSLRRGVAEAVSNSAKGDFKIYPSEFVTQVRELTIGIIGTGRIGIAEAELWKGIGCNVLGYDCYINDEAKKYLTFVSQDELLEKSDVVSLHVPHFPGKNDGYFNSEYISKMKDTAILVNTARGEITNLRDIADAVKNGKLAGFATDVFVDEINLFGKNFEGGKTGNSTLDEMIGLYPRVLITPHIGSSTQQALTDMISISYDNFNDCLTKGTTKYLL